MPDEDYLRLSFAKAREGVSRGQLPFGAAIVKGDEVISVTHNTIYTDGSIISHAETNAIVDACRELRSLDLSSCTLYATCEPCPMCFGACVLANISRVVFSVRLADGFIPGFNILDITNRELKDLGNAGIEVTGDVLREEGLGLFREWRDHTQGGKANGAEI